LQHLPNNSVRKIHSEKKKGLIGSIIIHSTLLLLLILIGFKIPPPPEFEEGIMVNFGTDETGFGLIEPAPLFGESESSISAAIRSTPATAPSLPARTSSTEQPLLTQDFEEAPEVRRVDPNAERRRVEAAERAAAEAAERQRLADQQRQSDISNNVRDALASGVNTGSPNGLAGSRNVGSTSTSEGVAGGTGNQGVPTGSLDSRVRGDGGSGTGNSGTGSGSGGSGNRPSYNLGVRRSQGELPNPRYNCQEAGIVVVEIRVNRDGRVVQANAGRPGSTSIVECLTSAAREAAMAARFTPDQNAPEVQIGTITYNFILR